jgi:hypothetical protein
MLLGRTDFTIESDYSLAESVERLASATRRPSLATMSPEAAVGRVDARRVRLVRVIPFVRNSFKPVFTGAFEDTDGRVLLRGSFGVHGSVKVFLCLWFGALLALALFGGWRAAHDGSDAWKFSLFCAGMMLFGVGLVALGRWFARNDEAWLSNVIRGALTRPAR